MLPYHQKIYYYPIFWMIWEGIFFTLFPNRLVFVTTSLPIHHISSPQPIFSVSLTFFGDPWISIFQFNEPNSFPGVFLLWFRCKKKKSSNIFLSQFAENNYTVDCQKFMHFLWLDSIFLRKPLKKMEGKKKNRANQDQSPTLSPRNPMYTTMQLLQTSPVGT